jgi:hypothetical protein
MRRALVILGLLLASTAASAEDKLQSLKRTAPAHMTRPLMMPFEKAVNPPLTPPEEFPPGILVRRVDAGMEKLGKIDRRLSEACQAGMFRELKPSKMIAVSKDATLGVAFGHGLGLVDPRKLADRTKVYYFYHGSTSFCMVRAENNWDPRYAVSR